ncbi:MAG: hypothetical protein WCQ57_13810, partial [Verrucomicrobiota bacterium]
FGAGAVVGLPLEQFPGAGGDAAQTAPVDQKTYQEVRNVNKQGLTPLALVTPLDLWMTPLTLT